MFKCELTGKVVGPGIKVTRVVVEKRKKSYRNVIEIDRFKKEVFSEGWEIVKELNVAPDEAHKLGAKNV